MVNNCTEIFINWLAEQGLLDEYVVEFRKQNKTKILFPYIKRLGDNNIIDVLKNSLNFEKCKKPKFWEEKDEQWRKYASLFIVNPKIGDYLYCSYVDEDDFVYSWISIFLEGDICNFAELASVVCESNSDDEIGEVVLNSFSFSQTLVRYATQKEIDFANNVLLGKNMVLNDNKICKIIDNKIMIPFCSLNEEDVPLYIKDIIRERREEYHKDNPHDLYIPNSLACPHCGSMLVSEWDSEKEICRCMDCETIFTAKEMELV